MAPEEAHFEQGLRGPGDHLVLPPPYGGVLHAGALEVVGARLLERVDAVRPVVLEMARPVSTGYEVQTPPKQPRGKWL